MTETRVMIVDDNELYRSAFARNLMLQNYDVVEAENADQAIAMLDEHKPDIVVTDLSMRTPTEGLDLIRAIKQSDPLLPVVLISAVGTFEEGSIAKELGAERVLMKQKIDEHIEELYKAIESARAHAGRLRGLKAEVEAIAANPQAATKEKQQRLRDIASMPGQHPAIVGEAYDALSAAQEHDIRESIGRDAAAAPAQLMQQVEGELKKAFTEFERFAPETQKEIKTAEYFYRQQGGDAPSKSVDFSRNIGFSYCFAVENEAKSRLKKRLQKFLGDNANIKLIRSLIDARGQLDIFYHQQLLRMQQNIHFDFTVDNVRQVFQRILEHESRYKPDGLKALGIMIACFGRDYTVKGLKGQVRIANPLALKGFESEEQALNFARLLVALQHYRNPYIHPEISEMEKISKIRETAFECLREISRF